ncbi:MAG: inorganic diphosphatase [Patescibacteria group bacterium]
MNLSKIKAGKNAPEDVNVIIEIPQGARVKYEMNKDAEVIMVDRFVRTTMGYPANYGFVPNTLSGDGDPVDVLVLCSEPLYPGILVNVVPIALLEMEDEAGIDAKVIAVPTEKSDPLFGVWKDVGDIPTPVKEKIKHFFEHYKELEPGKWVKIKDWKDKKAAQAEVTSGIAAHK